MEGQPIVTAQMSHASNPGLGRKPGKGNRECTLNGSSPASLP